MYLPEIFKTFLERHSDISDAFRTVGDLAAAAGPLENKAQHLIQLGVSIGVNSRGACGLTRGEPWKQGQARKKFSRPCSCHRPL